MESLEHEVRRELSRFGPQAGMGELVAVWPELVGAPIAANAWPARIAGNGTLHVAVSSSAWAFELTQLAPQLLERLRARLAANAPSALRFAVGHLPQPAGDVGSAPQGRVAPRPGAAEWVQAESLAAPIENDELRRLVARAAAASLARSVSSRPI
ncbi:MAG: DUF721 domain-containing protein [Actinobacteria bacterium]|nr:DUF721 domain-containing protein [Actinomycetota bacterium]